MEGASTAAVSKVLDDDDLLIEILLRVAFPTTLVRAALVCRRWFHCAADRAFLRRFRKLHPPRLLGYYRDVRFVPMMPQPPELAAVVRRVESYRLGGTDDAAAMVKDCRNGRVYAMSYKEGSGVTVRVHSPLCPDRAVAIVPPLSHPQHFSFASHILSREEEGGGLSYVYVSLGISSFAVYMLQDGVWCVHTSATMEYPTLSLLQAVLVDNKICMMFTVRDMIVLDLTTSNISTVKIPRGVEYASLDVMLSRADDGSGVYLIQVDLELRIWILRGDNWLLVDTICFREMVANLRMSDCMDIDEHTCDVQIIQVGDNAEFLFLEMGGFTLYLDIKCRTLRKVHERTALYPFLEEICPFMMIWPPTFPTLKHDFARDAL